MRQFSKSCLQKNKYKHRIQLKTYSINLGEKEILLSREGRRENTFNIKVKFGKVSND